MIHNHKGPGCARLILVSGLLPRLKMEKLLKALELPSVSGEAMSLEKSSLTSEEDERG